MNRNAREENEATKKSDKTDDDEKETLDLAFFKRGGKGKVIVDGTSLAHPSINKLAIETRDLLRTKPIVARQLKTLLIRSDQQGNAVWQLYVKDKIENLISDDEAKLLSAAGGEIIYSDPKSPASRITERLNKFSDTTLSDTILGVAFNYACEGFFQVNIPVYEKALSDMKAWINCNEKLPILDLYSGVGTIGLTIGGDDVTLVEINEHAVAEMQRNIAKLNRPNAKAILAPSEKSLEYITGEQKEKRLENEAKSEAARVKAMKQELEWVRQNAKGRQAKSKARLARFEEMSNYEYQKRNETQEIFIPVAERLGNEVIEFVNVSKSFGDKVLIDDLSFKVPAGAIVGIIGPNGAGKSTLFKMIAGKEQPDSGEVKIGQTVKMSLIDQSREGLQNDKTVFDNIAEGRDILQVGQFEIPARQYLGRFNFKGSDQSKIAGQLSGGERGRLHLAKTLLSCWYFFYCYCVNVSKLYRATFRAEFSRNSRFLAT